MKSELVYFLQMLPVLVQGSISVHLHMPLLTLICVLNHYQYHNHYKSLLLFFIYHALAIAMCMFSYTAIVMITVSCTLIGN